MCVSIIRNKDDVFEEFKAYKALMENRHGAKIKCIQSDNGREYINRKFAEFLIEQGIEQRTSAPYSPQQNGENGVAKRYNRTIVETARCSLL